MATPNLVPRADNEGTLGKALKRWLKGFFGSVHTTDITDGTNTATVAAIKGAVDHTAKTDNPHGVTAAQVGAEPVGAVSDHATRTDNPHSVTVAQIDAEPAGAVSAHTTIIDHAPIAHANRANLDTVNQNLGTTASPTFAAVTATGKINSKGLSAGFDRTVADPNTRMTGLWFPRMADVADVLYDFMDELYYADKRGTITVTGNSTATGGSFNLFRDDSNFMSWATTPSPLVIECDFSASPITAKNTRKYSVGLTFRSDVGVVNATHIKIEKWMRNTSSYMTVCDLDVTTDTGYGTWLSPEFIADNNDVDVPKLKITLTIPAYAGVFRLQRVMLYHASCTFDPWHLHIGGGHVYGDVQFDGKMGFFGTAPASKPAALTTADTSTVDATYGSEEMNVINNTRTRVNDLESRLRALGILP